MFFFTVTKISYSRTIYISCKVKKTKTIMAKYVAIEKLFVLPIVIAAHGMDKSENAEIWC